jgi:hypothetical protein
MAHEEVTQLVLSCICACGLKFSEGRVPEEIFKSPRFDLNVERFELHTIYRLRMLDITMMVIFCA